MAGTKTATRRKSTGASKTSKPADKAAEAQEPKAGEISVPAASVKRAVAATATTAASRATAPVARKSVVPTTAKEVEALLDEVKALAKKAEKGDAEAKTEGRKKADRAYRFFINLSDN